MKPAAVEVPLGQLPDLRDGVEVLGVEVPLAGPARVRMVLAVQALGQLAVPF